MMTNPISKREKEVLHLIAHEYTTKEIATKLYISTHTASSHRKNLIEKLGVKNTAGLVRVGFQRGMLSVAMVLCLAIGNIISQTALELEGKIEIEQGNGNVILGINNAANLTGGNNIVIGDQAGRDLSSSSSNIFIGRWAGLNTTQSGENIYIGSKAGKDNDSGFRNVIIGKGAGSSSEGFHNVIIGAESTPKDVNVHNTVSIGNGVRIACSDCAMIGPTGSNALNVGIGIDSATSPLHIKSTLDGPFNVKGFTIEDLEDEETWEIQTTFNALVFERNGVLKGSIDPTSGAYTALSDRRMKSDIYPMDDMLSDILQLQPSTYKYKEDKTNSNQIGFIAQEVQALFPELVKKRGELLTVNYDGFAVLAIQAIKEQQKLIEVLQDQMETLINSLQSEKIQNPQVSATK